VTVSWSWQSAKAGRLYKNTKSNMILHFPIEMCFNKNNQTRRYKTTNHIDEQIHTFHLFLLVASKSVIS
jgi:hypothetical protein